MRLTLMQDTIGGDVRADAESALGEWRKWANGEAYGYSLSADNGRVIDSRFGFIGADHFVSEIHSIVADAMKCAATEDRRMNAHKYVHRRIADRLDDRQYCPDPTDRRKRSGSRIDGLPEVLMVDGDCSWLWED